MRTTFASLGLPNLTYQQKRDIVADLMDEVSLEDDDSSDSVLSAAQKADLDRRIADSRANPDDWISWEEVKAASLKRLGQ